MVSEVFRERVLAIFFFLIAILFVVFDAAQAAENTAVLQMRQEITRLQEQRATIQKSENTISQSIERVRKASAVTNEQGDAESGRIARAALHEAQDALDTVQNLRAKIEMRIRSLENAQRSAPQGREFGVVTFSLGQAQVFTRNRLQSAEPGMLIFEGMRIGTDRGGYFELYAPDGAFVMLGPDSGFTVTEVDRINRIVMADVIKGRIHVEKTCAEAEDSRCWATRYSTESGSLSFGAAEIIYVIGLDGRETVTVLDGAAVFREKQTRKATTLRVGDQLSVSRGGESVSVKKVQKEDIQSWWDPDLRVRM